MVSFYRKDYPRPRFVRESWKNLNGSWDFAFDDDGVGEKAHWERHFPADRRTIQVPFSYETRRSGIGDETAHPVVWYRREMAPGGFVREGQRLLLHFEGVDYRTKVWVNGFFVGEHEGGCCRFGFDVTEAVTGQETAVITVRAEDSQATDQPRGKQRWKKESWGCWYIQTTGIWKTVWMEAVPEVSLASVSIAPDAAEKCLRMEAELRLPPSAAETDPYTLEAVVTFGGEPVAEETFAAGETGHFTMNLGEGELKLWSPETPNLYEITFFLKENGCLRDTVRSYFGFRAFEIRGDRLLLNGKPLFLRMVLEQGYWKDSGLTPPDEEALIRDIDLAFRFGYNGLRIHQKIEDERFLYWCDVKGMLVWSEMAACYDFSGRAAERFTAEWMEAVRQNRDHPSVCVWVPFNESWGLPGLNGEPRQRAFVNGIYYLTKALDPHRPVVTNDGWEHTLSDIVTIHDYRETGAQLEEAYLDGEQAVLNNKKSMSWYGQRLFADGYRYHGQPVILSEYGGIAMKRDEGWGYGAFTADEDEFCRRFGSQNEAIRKIPYFTGLCYTQLTDVQQEVNGLVDAERNPKLSPETEAFIAESNRSVGAEKEAIAL